jgi:hypothetical protein
MQKIRTLALAVALALAAFYLGLASVVVSAADSAVDIKGRTSETGQMDTATGAVTAEQSGVSSHLGKISVQLQGVATGSSDGSFTANETVTIESANGDQLWGTYTVTGTATNATGVITITGGTGRFANASGTLTMIAEGPPPRQEGQFIVFDRVITFDGQIVKGPKPAKPAEPQSSNDVAAIAPRSPFETTPPPAATTEPPASTRVLPDASPSPGTTASTGTSATSTGTSATEPNPLAGPSKPRPKTGKPGDSTISGPGKGRVNGAPSGSSASQNGGE